MSVDLTAADTAGTAPPPGGTSVHCNGVVHIYRAGDGEDVVALRGVDLDVAAGERVALLGPSGSGKSTLLSLLGGLLRPSAGRLRVGSYDVGGLSERELLGYRAAHVGTMLQGAARNLLPYATPERNLRFAQRALPRRRRKAAPPPRELLGILGLARASQRPIGALSGGEQQRVALGVALANGPGLLLADEPTSQLDAEHREGVLEAIERVSEQLGTTVVVVTHDPEVGLRLGRTVTMRDGRVGAEGRDGRDFSVIGVDGSLHLPDALRGDWPAGTLVSVEPDGGDLRITRESS
jgi:putative ABC transport system ATP-binding protein